MDPYATHVPILAWAVSTARGSILELGIGEYSTPLIHVLGRRGRVVSLETDQEYVDRFAPFCTDSHSLEHVQDWDDVPAFSEDWDVVFVDNTPAEARARCIERLRDRARLIVVHDTHPLAYASAPKTPVDHYGFEPVFEKFPHQVTCKWFPYWTTILSCVDPLHEAMQLFGSESTR